MSIFSGINVFKEAKEMKMMAYQSDIDAFNELRENLNNQHANGEGEILEQEIFSRMIQFALASMNGEAPKTEVKKPKKILKDEKVLSAEKNSEKNSEEKSLQ